MYRRSHKMDKNGLGSKIKKNAFYQECRAALAALNFLTILPVNRELIFSPQELGKSTAFYPIIGFLIGLLLLGLKRFFTILFPSSVVTILIIVCWAWISGALHLDGLIDTFDGIFGGTNPEERLKIMKDERVGAFALIGGILIMLTKYVILETVIAIDDKVLLLAPMISRWGMTLAIVGFPYARSEGLGYTIKIFSNWKRVVIASVFTIIAAWLISGVVGLMLILFSTIIVLVISYYVMKKISGLTGDTYGAINEIVEVWVLLVDAAFIKFI